MTALITSDGIVTRWPRKRAERQQILAHFAALFEHGRTYRESEVNDILNAHHTFGDWALLRREMFSAGIFDRDPKTQTYWRLPSPTQPAAQPLA